MIKIDEASKLLGVGVRHLQRLAKAGTVPAYKVGKSWLFKREELEQFINSKKRG